MSSAISGMLVGLICALPCLGILGAATLFILHEEKETARKIAEDHKRIWGE